MKLFEITKLPYEPPAEDDERARAHREMQRRNRPAPEKKGSTDDDFEKRQERAREGKLRAALADEKYEQIKGGSSIQTKYTATASSKEAAEKRANQIAYAYNVVDKKIIPTGDKFKLEITYYS